MKISNFFKFMWKNKVNIQSKILEYIRVINILLVIFFLNAILSINWPQAMLYNKTELQREKIE